MKVFQLIAKVSRKVKFFVFVPFWEMQALIFDFIFIMQKKVSTSSSEKKILIIKIDAIGDYVVFRNFLEQTRKSSKFKDYKIHLLGNVLYKDLALSLDKDFVDEFIWIRPSQLLGRFWILGRANYDLISKLKNTRYESVMNPTFTRQYLIDRLIIKNIDAISKIGFTGDNTNTPKFLNRIADCFYTKIIAVGEDTVFEFYRNRILFEQALGEKILLDRPTIDKGKTILDPGSQIAVRDDNITGNYIVIFPGAGTSAKQWKPQNFALIIDYIESKFPNTYTFVIMGGKGDMTAAEGIMASIESKNVVNKTGQTDLIELVNILSGASLLICNDTGAAHIAAALGTKTIFLLKGNGEFGRFGPYPPSISQNIIAVLPPKIGYNQKTYEKLCGKRFFTTAINDIKPVIVEKVIDEVL